MALLKISSLGDFNVTLAEKNITASFDTDKTRALLIYLALESKHAHPRQRLAGLLWPDQPEQRALQNLRQRLSQLRKTLGDETTALPFLKITRDTIQWNPISDFWLDAVVFEQTLEAAYRHFQRFGGQGTLAIRPLKQAVQYFEGQFLERFNLFESDLFEEWAAMQREKYNCLAVEAFAHLADYHERRGELLLARQMATRLTELTPWEETAQAQLMRLLAMSMQWSAAQHQYALLCRSIRQQLGVEPTPATVSLFEQIRLAAAQNSTFPARFPPAPHNLIAPPTSFVGREKELDILCEMLSDPECRLLTLLGPGGIGKTRLAWQVLQEQIGLYPDGVFFVPLSEACTPAQLLLSIAEAIGVVFTEQRDPSTQILSILQAKRLLLGLDNFEQLIATQENITLLLAVLQQARGVKLLITSRERLNLREEYIFQVEGLTVPSDLETTLDTAGSSDALVLFTRCIRQIRPGFSLDSTTITPVIQMCQTLGGLPLGIELAAAATWDSTPSEIARQITFNFNELASRAANMPVRHRSLRAASDVSWNLLSPALQLLFSQLAVFNGSFNIEAVSSIVELRTVQEKSTHHKESSLFQSPDHFASLCAILVDKSLLQNVPGGRYRLHEPTRQYAQERLAEGPVLPRCIQERHAQYYAGLLSAHNAALKGPLQAESLAALYLEIENIRSAWIWLVESKRSDLICLCADSLYNYFNIRSYFQDGVLWFTQTVKKLSTAPVRDLRAEGICLARLGALEFRMRRNLQALEALTSSQAIFQQLGEPEELAFCLVFLSGIYMRQADHQIALGYADQSLALYRASGSRWGEAYALYLSGLIKNRQGLFEDALPYLEEALAIGREVGDPHRLIAPLNLLGDIACVKGDYLAAEKCFLESLEISKILNDRYNQGLLYNNLATIYQALKAYDKEQAAFEKSLAVCREISDRDGEAIALNGLGEMAVHLGEYEKAVEYSEQALQIAQQLNEVWTMIVCRNNLGEALCGSGELDKAESHLLKALHDSREMDAQDLISRVEASLGRVHQQRRDFSQAGKLFQKALANPALEDEPRAKILYWMSDMVDPDISFELQSLED